MALREFRLPDLGEGLTESEIVAWKVSAGDRIELNQVIAEVETAKAVVDLPSPFAGIVARLMVDAGVTVAVGDPIITVETADAAGEEQDAEAPPPNLVGYGATEESSSARTPRRFAGAPVESPVAAPVPMAESPAPAAEAPASARRRAAPPVRLLARQLGISLDRVEGTGEHGLITRADLERMSSSPTPVVSGDESTLIPVTGVRKLTAKAMVESAFTAPHATVFLQVDVTPTIELLERLRGQAKFRGSRLTFLTAVARGVCLALADEPSVNARWEEGGIRQFRHVNLGIAAATPRGLLVPVIPAADTLSFQELDTALTELVQTARAGTTPPAAMTGGTFTITNVGVFGVEGGTPILADGQAGILAVGAVARRPWEFNGEIALRSVVTLSLSFDHRVVDGAEGSRLLAAISGFLADPARAFVS
ncbi:MAG TPA: dihydrolipoamide acetyltransferase family protein [Pseudolysinimonas sp.]|nr:dihydrolipoamide acetyltransferase family protein [Pseudolysinimonas sp.]